MASLSPGLFKKPRLRHPLDKDSKGLRILVTGKAGQGKSTLINGILGKEVAREDCGDLCTTKVEVYDEVVKGVPITVFDSPGLQNCSAIHDDQIIQEIRDKCQELSVVLYCIAMNCKQLIYGDKSAMMELTKAFGEEFWDNAVFVLTFANLENCARKNDRDSDDPIPDYDDKEGWAQLKKKRFQGRLKHWGIKIQKFLIEEIRVSDKIARRIPVIPTGYNRITFDDEDPFCLLDRDDWLQLLLEACSQQVKDKALRQPLNIRDLDIVIKELTSTQHLACAVWHDLGLQLGLYEPRLVDIDDRYRGHPVKCFRECMSAWLRGEDKVKDKDGPSWLSLASALETIGEHHIATNIEDTYC